MADAELKHIGSVRCLACVHVPLAPARFITFEFATLTCMTGMCMCAACVFLWLVLRWYHRVVKGTAGQTSTSGHRPLPLSQS